MTQRQIAQSTDAPSGREPELAAAADDVEASRDQAGDGKAAAENAGPESNDEYEEL